MAAITDLKVALAQLAQSGGGELVLPAGTYPVNDNLVVDERITLRFMNGAKLVVASGKSITINGSVEAGLFHIFDGPGKVEGNMKVSSVYPEWFGAKGDGINDDTDGIEKTLQFLDKNQGGVLALSEGTYILRYLYLRSKVTVQGNGPSSILKLKNGTHRNLISLKDNSVMQFRLSNFFIDGNRAYNAAGCGIYLNKTAYVRPDHVMQGNAGDINSTIENIFIYGCAEHGIFLDRTQSSGEFVNIRGIIFNNVQVISCQKSGIKLNQNTDGKFSDVICTGNAHCGFEIQGCANNYYVGCKTFYNGFAAPASVIGGGFVMKDSGRSSFIGCEAQEEYKHGFYAEGCSLLSFSACCADSNGQENSTYSGYYLKNTQLSTLMGCNSTSFHSPSWQYTGVTFENCSGITSVLSVNNQLSRTNYILKGTNTKMSLTINGEAVR